MRDVCQALHHVVNAMDVHRFPYHEESLPTNGVYVFFEEGERGHGGLRIVRTGSHSGKNQLRPRLNEHFVNENKDRSIFRKNIGRALLNRAGDPFLEHWNLDLTSRKNRQRYEHVIDFDKQAEVERQVTERLRSTFSFAVLEVMDKADRMELERKLIGTVSSCQECGSSHEWLGTFSPKPKIRDSGLWQEQHLWTEALTHHELGSWLGGD